MEHVVCNLCGARDASRCCRVGEFQIVRCNGCGLIYTNPRRSAETISDIYSKDYFFSENPAELGYDDYSMHAEGLKEVFSDHLEFIERFVRPPASIIDIGCAFGYFLESAKARGWTVEGVEVSPFASNMARRNAGVRVHVGTLPSVGLAASAYDAATMWDVLEHSFDPAAELAETNRILKPGGYLFMTVPNAGSFLARSMGSHWYGFKKAAEHNYFFSRDTLNRMLSRTGFTLVESRRGVWPCSMRFLVTKLTPYSRSAHRLAQKVIQWVGIENAIVKFRFIDMFVVARKHQAE